METDNITLKTLLASLMAVVAMEFVAAGFSKMIPAPALLIVGCARLVDIFLLLVIVFRFEKRFAAVGFNSQGISVGIQKGILWSVFFGAAAVGFGLILFFFDINPLLLIRTRRPAETSDLILLLCVGGIVSPVAEEILFRGIIFGFLRKWGFLFAILLSTAIFSALHPQVSGVPAPQIIGGVLFAVAYEIEKNLMVPIVIHVCGNLAIFTITWLRF